MVNETLRMRVDARRNRDQILMAARDLFVRQGAGAPLEEVARRAGVGIATLYRRFPDRRSLLRGVALDVLGRLAQEARLALAEEPEAFRALARYMHHALDLRVGAVMPALLGGIPTEDEALLRAREDVVVPVQEMIGAAQADGTLRPDVAFGDIGIMIIRLSRPLPGPFPGDLENSLAHRHLDLLIGGLRVREGSAEILPGPSLTLADLRTMFPDANHGTLQGQGSGARRYEQ